MIAIPLFALLRGRQEQHGTLSLFQSGCCQISGGRLRKFLQCPLRLSMGRRIWLELIKGNSEGSRRSSPLSKNTEDGVVSTNSARGRLKWACLIIFHPRNLFS